VFGLTAACDASRRHFPGISNWPLAVGQAVQSARATFTATGFEAAAVTAMGLLGLPLPEPPRHTVRVIRLTFDRPFGFVAIDRPSGLVLVAGWVALSARGFVAPGAPGGAPARRRTPRATPAACGTAAGPGTRPSFRR
jgi:serine protease inhibitor